MAHLRPLRAFDLLQIGRINLDPFTENYSAPYYFQYLLKWPHLCTAAQGVTHSALSEEPLRARHLYVPGMKPSTPVLGYVMGKADANAQPRPFGHVSALSVSPIARRTRLASRLMAQLESISETLYQGHFVDLFVRQGNLQAVKLYERLGYTVYRRVLQYYTGWVESDGRVSYDKGDEDAFDMRKALKYDPDGKSCIPLGRAVHAHEL